MLLQGSVNWEAGQQVLLTTTAIKDARDWHRNEVRTIASVTPITQSAWAGTGVGAVVELTSAAQADHEANSAYQVNKADPNPNPSSKPCQAGGFYPPNPNPNSQPWAGRSGLAIPSDCCEGGRRRLAAH